MKSKFKTVVVGILVLTVLVLSGILYSTCKSKNALLATVKLNEEKIASLQGNIDSINGLLNTTLERNDKLQKALDADILQRQAEQEAAKHEREKLRTQITLLETELQPLIDANPKLRELIGAYQTAMSQASLQIVALEAERDDWHHKFDIAVSDRDAALLAKAAMQAALESCMKGFTKANNDLSNAGKTISRQKGLIKTLAVVGIVPTAALGGLVVLGMVHKR